MRLLRCATIGRRVTAAAFSFATLTLVGTAAQAGILAVGPGYFGAGTTTVTFSEVANGTTIPFTVGLADFVGLAGVVVDTPGSGAPPAPSGGQYLYSSSLENQDVIEVMLGAPQEAVGAYFNVLGGGGNLGVLQLELYSGNTLLGTVLATPDGAGSGGFVGGSAGSAIIDRVIFRDIDDSVAISFRLDDFQFVPAPGAVVVLLPALLGMRRRRVR